MRFSLFLLVAIGGACLTISTASARAPSRDAELAQQEARLAAVGYRLTTASARWCPHLAPQPGWILNDPRRFDPDDRAALGDVYGARGDGPFIAAIAPGSPAARAGLPRGIGIAAINGQPIPTLGDEATIRIDAVVVMLAALDPAAALTVTDSAGRIHNLDAAPGCASSFRIEQSGPPAAANGTLVRLTRKLAASVVDDAGLAVVVAHELAHNILRHRARLARDRSIARIRQTENEADQLTVWLLADAGYDPMIAVRFWQSFKMPMIRAATHPPRRERIATIKAEAAAMIAARAADPNAPPPLTLPILPLE